MQTNDANLWRVHFEKKHQKLRRESDRKPFENSKPDHGHTISRVTDFFNSTKLSDNRCHWTSCLLQREQSENE